ncbi:MAG: SMP-30/gluconolactonase/LRE family protein [Verrucomicrobiota bacterium]
MKVSPTFFALAVLPLTAYAADLDVRNADAFSKCVSATATLQRLGTDMKFLEGPQWVPSQGGYLIFSDIPSNELKKWTPKEGISVFRQPSNNANGNTLDHQGRLISAEHSGRRVSITDETGNAVTVVDQFEGKKLNSPNDVVVSADGALWFTDPDYGLASDPTTKQKIGKEIEGDFVFRFDPKTKALAAVAKDFNKPNGLCFSPDGKRLYVADSGAPRHIRSFDVQSDGRLENGRVFAKIDNGSPDGIRCDTEGRLWSSAGDGIHVFSPSGDLLGKILVPEAPANLAFGGPEMKTLFITARKSLYSIEVNAQGIR